MRYYERVDGFCRWTETQAPAFSADYDLIVIGLGAAGAFCAWSAAREGLSVLGAERGACCGGASVQGAVNGYYNGYLGGSWEEVDAEANAVLGVIYRPFYNNPDAKKIRLEQRLLQAGVEIRYRTAVLGVYAEDQQIRGVRLLCEGRIQELGCRFLTDSTGDGALLWMLDLTRPAGRPADGATAPFSSVRVFRPQGQEELARTNHDSGYIDPFDDEAFSRSVITANGKHADDADRQRERFLYVAPQIGIREGRTLMGEKTLTLADILEETPWPDTLICGYSDIDKHGSDSAFDSKLYQDWFVISNLSTVTFKLRVPLGCLAAKGWKGLLAVSRCLSVDSYASSAIRMNRDMYRLGEAAGVAIAQAVKAGTNDVQALPYGPLHARIRALNCYDPRPTALRGFVSRPPDPRYLEVHWMTDWEEITSALGTDRPGVAIWSCRRLGAEAAADRLYELTLRQDQPKLRKNAAVALGLLGDCRCVPVLREMVRGRSEYHYLDCRRTNQMPSVIAICLLGRFGDTEILPDLYDILRPEEFGRPMYHVYLEPCYKLSIVRELNSVYYKHFSFTVAALAAVAAQHPGKRGEILAKLHEAVDDQAYVGRMTGEPPGSSYDRIARDLYTYVQRLRFGG